MGKWKGLEVLLDGRSGKVPLLGMITSCVQFGVQNEIQDRKNSMFLDGVQQIEGRHWSLTS